MGQFKKFAKAGPRKFWQDQVGAAADRVENAPVKLAKMRDREENSAISPSAHFKIVSNGPSDSSSGACADLAAPPGWLSVRAENVLKGLAEELIGECPPQGRWIPPDRLVQRLTYKDLSIARNCGPQTTAEIIRWAHTRGNTIQRPLHAGKSLSAMWQNTIARFSEGEISKSEVIEVLEKSTRRGNTRIPVAFQKMLLHFVNSSKWPSSSAKK